MLVPSYKVTFLERDSLQDQSPLLSYIKHHQCFMSA